MTGCIGHPYGHVDPSRCLVPGGPPFLAARLTPSAPGDLGWFVQVDDRGSSRLLEAERSHEQGSGAIEAGEPGLQNVTIPEVHGLLESFGVYDRSFDHTAELAFRLQPRGDDLRGLCGIVLNRFLGVEDWQAGVDDASWWNVSVSTAEGEHQAVYEDHGGQGTGARPSRGSSRSSSRGGRSTVVRPA